MTIQTRFRGSNPAQWKRRTVKLKLWFYPVSTKTEEEHLKFHQNNEWSPQWEVRKGDGATTVQLWGLLILKPFDIYHEADSSYPWAARHQFAAQVTSRSLFTSVPQGWRHLLPARGPCRTSAHGVITDSHLEEAWLLSQLLSRADIPYFLEGIGVCYHLVAGCDSSELHAPHGSLLIQAAVGLSFPQVGPWAKLFVSLARISMLSLPAELPKYHFISNERSALAMQRIHKDQASGSGKNPERGGGKSQALSS